MMLILPSYLNAGGFVCFCHSMCRSYLQPYRATVLLSADSPKIRQPTAHCITFASRTKPTHRPKLAEELQFCQRTQAHPPPEIFC